MKPISILIILLFSYTINIKMLAQDSLSAAKNCFYETKQELTDMLDGRKPLNYEQAIIAIENAYWKKKLNTALFSQLIDLHTGNIQKLIDANRDYSKQNFKSTFLQTEEQKRANYETALANWAIYTYMTDTTIFVEQDKLWYNLPLDYSIQDPMGTADWQNTQVANLLSARQGNCYAQTALFKIFSERLQSQAAICTAPGHIYIRHANEKGTFFNVEPATRTFPGTGSIETLTYTSDEATRNGISLRELNLKQSVALCLVYLAKGYEYRFHTQSDDFLLECAETALLHDKLNLNAMLLKAEVLEERIIQKNRNITELQTDKDFADYESWINHIHKLGYREMPLDMKNALIAGLRKENFPYMIEDKTPQPYKHLGVKDERYATLSRGFFEEFDFDKPVEQYGRTLFDSKKKKIVSFSEIPQLYNEYNFDPVVFAWQIDPLAHKIPNFSPYVAFNDNPIYYVDPDGKLGISAHAEVTKNTAELKKLTSTQTFFLVLGSKNADYLGFSEDWHFDNMSDFQQIENAWANINQRIAQRPKWDFYGLGADLHNIQDFYAHSNYVELYVEFYQSTGGDMKDFDVASIPTFDAVNSKFKQYLKENLRTGTWDDLDNEKMLWTDENKLSEDSHYKINKDNNTTSLKGKEKIKGTNSTYYDAVIAVAQKHTNKIVKENEKSDD